MTDKEIATVESLRKDGILSLKDSHGNPRFVEGDITMETISGITQTYGKWSLSGTHLMIVFTGRIASGTYIGGYTNMANINVPTYILNKVPYLITGRADVRRQYFPIYSTNTEILAQKLFYLAKLDNKLNIGSSTLDPVTINEDGYFRIQFDLLIDAD